MSENEEELVQRLGIPTRSSRVSVFDLVSEKNEMDINIAIG